MTSWEWRLQEAVTRYEVTSLKAVLASDEVKKEDCHLGRKEWRNAYPFQLAACYGSEEMIRAMAEAGFDVSSHWVYCDERMDWRLTALHEAVRSRNADTVKLLLDMGADPTLKGQMEGPDFAPGTPLEWARRMKGREDIVRILEEHLAASTLKFTSMDSVAKLKQRSHKVKELEEARTIQNEIEDKKEEIRKMEEDLKGLEEKVSSLLDIREIEKQLEEIDDIRRIFKEVLKETCPTCSLAPDQVFACQECEHWSCQDCKDRVVVCPSCRQDLDWMPMVRCRAMEKHINILAD